MFENLLKTKVWNGTTNNQFFDEVNDYFNDEKCIYTAEVANELINRGEKANLDAAAEILHYVADNFSEVDDKNSLAAVYYTLGKLYETKLFDYSAAYSCYEKYELNNTLFDGASILLFRMLLLRDNFTYSEELEKILTRSLGELDLGLRTDRLYETIAKYVVAEKYGETEKCDKYKKRIKAIIKADEIFVQDLFCRKDDFRDVIEVPKKVLDFADSL